jgi:hypothetical protein
VARQRLRQAVRRAAGPGASGQADPARPDNAYIGTYRNPVYGDVKVIRSSGRLAVVEGPAKNTYPMTHLDGDTFTITAWPETPDSREPITFTIGSDGRAKELQIPDTDGPGTGLLKRVG